MGDLKRNIYVAFSAQFISLLVSFLTSLVVPKVLSVANYGYWQLFIFYTNYVGFLHLGLNDGIYLINGGKTRSEIDKRDINSQFIVSLIIQSVFAFAISFLACRVSSESDRIFVICTVALFMVVANASSFLGYLFQAMNETRIYSFSTMVDRASFLMMLLGIILFKVDSFQLLIVFYLISKAFCLIYCVFNAKDFLISGLERLSITADRTLSSIKVGCLLMLANVSDSLILGVMQYMADGAWGIETFGSISFAITMVNFFLTFVLQVSMVLFPALRQSSSAEQKRLYINFGKILDLFLPAVYLLCLPIIQVLSIWLPQYKNSLSYFICLIPICVFNARMSICNTTYFKVLRMEKSLFSINLVTVLASALLSAFSIFVLNSVYCALLGAVACIIARSIFASGILNKRMGHQTSLCSIGTVILTVVFVVSSITLGSFGGFIVYLLTYSLYCFLCRKDIYFYGERIIHRI